MPNGPHQRHDDGIAVKARDDPAEVFSMSTSVHRMSTPCPPMSTACPPHLHQCPPHDHQCPPHDHQCPPHVHPRMRVCVYVYTTHHNRPHQTTPHKITPHHTRRHRRVHHAPRSTVVGDRGLFETVRLEKFGYFWQLERPLQTEDGIFDATVVVALPRPPKPQC